MSKKYELREKKEDFTERKNRLNCLEEEFVNSFVSLRKQKKLTQQEMADNGGVIRETIARIENRITSPQVDTLLKILEPIGYTVKITRISKKKNN